jgi:hypothetical protein
MMTYAAFQPGIVLGRHAITISATAVQQWVELFPDDRMNLPTMPAGMMAMVLMRAFTNVLRDRPRGNVHAGQKFWISRLPEIGESMTTTLHCAGKEEKNGRRWVTLSGQTTGPAGDALFRSEMTTIWAA